jgi:hypothetical protein
LDPSSVIDVEPDHCRDHHREDQERAANGGPSSRSDADQRGSIPLLV